MSAPAGWVDEADGVFRGGGVKGIALAGALEGFAHHPTKPVRRWVNVAGASAGAIIACYLACGHDADAMLRLLRQTEFAQFADFPGGSRALGVGRLLVRHGMAPGDAFRDWFDGVLGGATFGDLRRDDPLTGERDWRLKLIAVDVTNRKLLVLPDDLGRYRLPDSDRAIEPDGFRIAHAARMSMAIPYFFDPVELVRLDSGRRSLIVDGGTLSNFPVWLFDVDPVQTGRAPVRPTFGFTLVHGRSFAPPPWAKALTPWPVRFAFDIFHTAQDAWDDRFVSHSTRVRTLAVDADDVATTDFHLSEEKQQLLIANGEAAARTFLDHFDLTAYRNTFHAEVSPTD